MFPALLFGFLFLISRSPGVSGIGALKKSVFLPPYTKDGRATFAALRGRSGVYVIKQAGRVVYVGFSGYDVYKTLYRHFQVWNHSRQEVVSYKDKPGPFLVRVLLCSASQAPRFEAVLINKLRPRDNANKLEKLSRSLDSKKLYSQYSNAADAPF